MKRLVETFAVQGTHKNALDAAAREALGALTDREREILVLVARGMSNEAIADELFISPATVKTHLARIMTKTDTHDRAQLVILAYEAGLVVASFPSSDVS